jgi:hypothetical protein
MRYIILLFASFFLMSNVVIQAQDNYTTGKEKKKLEKKAEEERNYITTGNLLDSMKFVLEADYLSNQRGTRVIVPTSLNFIKVDSTNAVLQIGRNTGMGNNGVGGTTAEGRISKYDVTKNDKKKTYSVRMNILSNLGSYDVFMDVLANGSARATISGTYPGKLTWEGDIVALEESRVYQGRTLY